MDAQKSKFDSEQTRALSSPPLSRRQSRLPRSSVCILSATLAVPAFAGNLPVPCIASGSCSNGKNWVEVGAATATSTASKLTVNQTSQNALLNWQSFNIGKGASVNFVQPNASALAINQIWQGSPSQIMGSLTANGRIYLINQNGIMFGAGAQVNVGGLVASTLKLQDPTGALNNGIAPTSALSQTPAFVVATDPTTGAPVINPITVAQGATLNSTGGQIFLFAPQITNEGTITTPNGQTILAAGTAVYLATSTDPNLRGLTVAVDGAGAVTNGNGSDATVTDPSKLVGQIIAQHGNVTLLGLAVNQNGLVSANTSVAANGTILLVAANQQTAGNLTIGPNSATLAGLDTSDTSLAVDSTTQQKSAVTLQGNDVNVATGASIVATSGSVTFTGYSGGVSGVLGGGQAITSASDGSRVYIADGANIDVSGATATLPMSANTLEVQLRGSELADEPLQRDGALRGQTVTVDVRQYGTLSDGTQWVGTPLANLSGDVATIQRGILERNEVGGTVKLQSYGDVIVGSNAKINVSGGASQYQAGYLNVSSVIGADGQIYSLSNASPNIVYKGVATTTSVSFTDPRWGVTKTYNGIYGAGLGQYQAGYIQGADAGALSVNAPHVIFDGSLVANVQVGPFQRKPATATLDTGIFAGLFGNGSSGRPYDQLPLPGELNVGPGVGIPTTFAPTPDLVLPSIDFAAGPVLPSVHNADGTAFNPLTDPWPTSVTGLTLDPELIGANAAGRVSLEANGTITLPVGVDLQLPVGGSFSAVASNIDIGGTITSPGAKVSLATVPTIAIPPTSSGTPSSPSGITLDPTAVLNLAGAWVNDNPSVTPTPPTAPLALNGGSVTLAALDGNITLAPGALIDVSGGAQLQANGTLTAGTAGVISISTSGPVVDGTASPGATSTDLSLGATLRGYGVSKGGTLSLSASAFCVTAGAACAALSADPTADPTVDGTVTLAPDFFTTGGFASYSLSANFGGLEITSGTRLQSVQENFILTNTLLPSAPTLSGVAPVGILPAIQRQPVNLSFSTQYVVPLQGIVSPTQFAAAPSLSLDAGSAIVLDPLASVTLTSNTRILDDGLIATPGGNVSMTVTNKLVESGTQFIAGHQLWLGPDSIVDVSGAVQALTNDSGNTVGNVLPGGSVTLTALRGAVETLPGSLINVSGTSGTLDIQQVNSAGAATFEPTVVASAGGSVNIQAAEAALLNGSMEATSGNPATVPNGSFSLVLEGNDRYGASLASFTDVPDWGFAPRVIQLSSTQAPVIIAAGTDLPDAYAGQALVSTSSLAAAGFDAVSLKAVSLDGGQFTPVFPTPAQPSVAGEIQFNGNVSLNLGRSLTLDAASFLSTGGKAVLGAPYVSLGQSSSLSDLQGVVGSTNSGVGSLVVNGSMIDLSGYSAFGGFASVELDSSGDIRANGIQIPLASPGSPLSPQLGGALTVSGALDLIAQQIYPSTLTAFTFTSGAGGTGDLSIAQAKGTAAGPLLSAGGTLTFNAPDITQAGTVRAPLGSIVMNATNITLAAGSTTSTSTDGQTIPFGETQGGFDWIFPTSDGNLVYGTDGIPLPTQTIQLAGTSVKIYQGATLDVKGGGDLMATEFIPGPTGTHDVLAGSGSFAILPTSNLAFAPNDPLYSSGSGVSAGETIYLSGGGGIPAGTYAVLPARYALLPGAYYVTPVSGYQDLTPGQRISQSDGSVIVSGYMSYAGTTLGASRTSGFDIEKGTAVQNLAQYTLTSANEFFTNQATNAGVPVQRLPQDAGYLGLSATSQLTLNGTLEATPGTGGLGAALDISSSAILVTNGGTSTTPDPNVLNLDANQLTQFGAQSVLLGGVRTETSKGLEITTLASTVEVASGATLKGPELLLAASDSVTVDSGATVGSSGSLPTSDSALLVSGDGALLRVAAGGNPIVTRTGTSSSPTQGQVSLLAGSLINAPGGSATVDAAESATFGGTLRLAGGSLSISGNQISLGNVPTTGVPGIILPTAVLDGLSVADLSLASRGSIDFYDGSSLSGTNVSLSGSALRGKGMTAIEVSASGVLTLSGSSSPSAPVTGSGTLALNGGTVSLQGGSLDISGFSNVSISSQGLMNVSSTGTGPGSGMSTGTADAGTDTLSVEGNLNLEAGLLSADSGVTRKFDVSGAFVYNPTPNPASITPPTETPLGASLSVQAQSIAFNGSAQLHAGMLKLTATGTGGDITLGSGASIDLSAAKTMFDGLSVASPAGILALQSQSGSISAAQGSVINVSAVDNSVANAGALSAQAASGAVNLNGQLLGSNADISVDGQSLGNVPALESALVAGGFTGNWNLRLRGPGDLVVPAGASNAITGRSVSLTADQGSIDVEGTITSNRHSGGSITLSALNDVTVNGTLDARPNASGQMNGQIELATEQGRVVVGSGATIEAYDPSVAVQSVADGGLWIRVPESIAPSGLALAGNLQGLRSVTIEGFQAYSNTTGTLDATDLATVKANAASFMQNDAPALLQALGNVKGPTPQIVPGIEIDSNQSLTLTSDWDMSGGGTPGVLTLRSAGDLTFNGSLSDGFSGTTGSTANILTSTGPSWSYRLVAGADLTSANPMAVQPQYQFSSDALAASTYGTGSVYVGGPNSTSTMIRTGTGSINIAAAGDVTLANSGSVIYTAGIADSGITYTARGQLQGLLYPTEGGDISISAGQDVVGAQTPDLVTNWLWRVGSDTKGASTAWTVNFADFQQGVGALGGGNVTVTAGRNVSDLSVSVPTIGRQVGSTALAGNDVQVLNEGDIAIRAGNNVAGGSLYEGSGAAVVVAGNQITQSPTVSGLYPMVLLGDATVTLSARAGATLAGVANPTLLAQGTSQNAGQGNNYSYFSTYGPNSAVALQTTTGTAELVNDTGNTSAIVSTYTTVNFNNIHDGANGDENGTSSLRIYPGTLSVDSLRGNLTLDNTLTLYPEANGSVDLLAHGAVQLGSSQSGGAFDLIQSNVDPTLLPTADNPQGSYATVSNALAFIVPANALVPQNAAVPVHLTGSTPDSSISRIVSLTGDVSMEGSQQGLLTFAAPAQIVAGRDALNLSVDFTNLTASDVSAIVAGRDIIYPTPRDAEGVLNSGVEPFIEVDGPGTLELVAGRNVDLGTSAGVTSRGNTVDTSLTGPGASVSILAGVGDPNTQNYSTFINDYLTTSSLYTSDLVSYMQPLLGGSPTAAQALSAFQALPTTEQAPLIQTIFFDELLASGTAAAPAGPLHLNFTRGYDAIEALFPNSVPSLSGNKPSPYSGNVSLFFSKVYTLAGGSVNLLAPGGLVDVGLAAAPATFGITKAPSDLGVVVESTGNINAYTYGNFEVNESRVFAADGGNITIWSTDGNIDAGRGSKTAISAPPPTITYVNGVPTVTFLGALTGSGIQTLATSPDVSPGNVSLFAPNGVVNANDAGIVAGNLTIAATAVLGANNIKVSGVSVGVPVAPTGLGAGLAGVSAVGSSASQSATEGFQENANRATSTTPVADATLGWLDVFIEGFGEEVCKPSDAECLKRQTKPN